MSRSREGGACRSVAGGPRVWSDLPVYLDATAHTRSNYKNEQRQVIGSNNDSNE